MASQIMDKILEAEKLCDIKKEEAKKQSAEILGEAEKKASAMKEQARRFAKDRAKAITDVAQKNAALLLSEKQTRTQEKINEMRAACEEKRSFAVKQTALYLLELSKGR